VEKMGDRKQPATSNEQPATSNQQRATSVRMLDNTDEKTPISATPQNPTFLKQSPLPALKVIEKDYF